MNAAKTSEKPNIDLINDQQAKRLAQRAQANRDELTLAIAQAIGNDGTIELISGLRLNRSSSPSEPCHAVSVPSFCVIAQGSKEVLLGNDRYQYDRAHYLLATAYQVGYDDASHFNWEYKRLFGTPPMRDVERLREAARETASSI